MKHTASGKGKFTDGSAAKSVQKVDGDLMEKFKPCPFCGGEAIVELKSIGSGPGNSFSQDHVVKCKKCGANTGKQYHTRFCREDGEFVVSEDGYAQAVADWNRRAAE